jgi:type IX secretion system PorP/SprF family membrane protein
MRNYIIFVLFLCLVTHVSAQQDHQYTQFMYNKLMINPGYAGARGVPSISGIYRNQWLGFEGAPVSQIVSFHTPILSPRVGVGATVSHRTIGLGRDLLAQLAYSYDLIASNGNLLRFGVHGVARNTAVDLTKSKPVTGGIDPFSIDPSIENRRVSNMSFNFGSGLYASFQDMVYFGVSMPSIIKNRYGIDQVKGAREVQHLYIMAGGAFRVNDDLVIMPSILTKSVKNAPFDADINLSFGLKERITTGVSYRLGGDGGGESVDILMMVNLSSQLGIGMAYDFPLSQIKDYSTGSVELSAFYDLRKRETKDSKLNISNPRFFF